MDRIIDVGCASGGFLYYLLSLYPNLNLAGIDVSGTAFICVKMRSKTIDLRRQPEEFFKFLVALAQSQLSAGSTVLEHGVFNPAEPD